MDNIIPLLWTYSETWSILARLAVWETGSLLRVHKMYVSVSPQKKQKNKTSFPCHDSHIKSQLCPTSASSLHNNRFIYVLLIPSVIGVICLPSCCCVAGFTYLSLTELKPSNTPTALRVPGWNLPVGDSLIPGLHKKLCPSQFKSPSTNYRNVWSQVSHCTR